MDINNSENNFSIKGGSEPQVLKNTLENNILLFEEYKYDQPTPEEMYNLRNFALIYNLLYDGPKIKYSDENNNENSDENNNENLN